MHRNLPLPHVLLVLRMEDEMNLHEIGLLGEALEIPLLANAISINRVTRRGLCKASPASDTLFCPGTWHTLEMTPRHSCWSGLQEIVRDRLRLQGHDLYLEGQEPPAESEEGSQGRML